MAVPSKINLYPVAKEFSTVESVDPVAVATGVFDKAIVGKGGVRNYVVCIATCFCIQVKQFFDRRQPWIIYIIGRKQSLKVDQRI